MSAHWRWGLLCGALILAGALGGCARPAGRSGAGATPAAQASASSTSVESIQSGGQDRQFRQHVPDSYRPGTPAALVINLHGYSSNAKEQEQVSQMSKKADSAGFIVVYPEGLGSPQRWSFGSRAEGQRDVAFIRDLIAHMQGQFTIDPKRIYVTGISNGAQMSYRLACDLGDTIAAFAPVSGSYPPFKDCPPVRPIPVVIFHGTADRLLPYAGNPPLTQPVREWAASWAARNGCAATPSTTFQKDEVKSETWASCQAGADVVLYSIDGKGHSWPGSRMPAEITTRTISATDIIWDFFSAHPMP